MEDITTFVFILVILAVLSFPILGIGLIWFPLLLAPIAGKIALTAVITMITGLLILIAFGS